MGSVRSIEEARRWFAEDLRVAAPVTNNPAIVDAFAKVPREAFLGEGPWRVRPRQFDRPAYVTASDDPRHVYHDLLISIDHERDLNNGQPSLWAYYFDQLALGPGASVLQVGAGVGYFTAILAELVTSVGRVIAYEVDANLARRAAENLRDYENVEVIAGDAAKAAELPSVDAIAVFAGATHVPETWLSSLAPSGRIVIPLTCDDQWGFMLLLESRGDKLSAASLGSCGFYHCSGARNASEAVSLQTALSKTDGKAPELEHLHRGQPETSDGTAWFVGDGFWISKAG